MKNSATLSYKPIDACIYCGSIENLSDEHIVPFGLSGRWILPKASCVACARITSRFETYCLQKMLILPRRKFNLKSRRPKKQPTHLAAGIVSNNGYRLRNISFQEYPVSLMLPSFEAPRVLLGLPPIEGIFANGYSLFFNELWEKNKQILGPGTAFHGEFEVSAFCRMLSKIAYGFAVADGLCSQSDRLPIVDAILGQTQYTCHFVGCLPTMGTSHEVNLHEYSFMELGSCLVCNLRLFAAYGAHPFAVVVRSR